MLAVRRTTTVLTTGLATGLVAALLATGTVAAAPAAVRTVDLEPAELTRGPDIAVPHVEGDDLVVGDRRIDLPAARAGLLGASGGAHVVVVSRLDGRRGRVLRVEADGTLTTLLPRSTNLDVQLSEDGRHLVTVRYDTRRASAVSVRSARTGDLLVTRRFRGYPSVLASRGGKVLISADENGVRRWSFRSGRIATVTKRHAGRASLTHDLLSTYTTDPYDGGCTVVTRLSRPDRTLWKSCTQRVDSFSADGTRMATIDLLSDGIGPGAVVQREIDGTRLAAYTSTGWFGAFSWESSDTMLLETHGKEETAVVRCELDDCENATDPEDTEELRPAVQDGRGR